LIEQLEAQAAPFKPVYHLRQTVDGLERVGDVWQVRTSAGQVLESKVVFIAAGAGAFGPNRPPLAGIETFESTGGVQYCVRRIEDYRGKKVVIAGGGDSAVDWALALQPVAGRVTVVHRRDRFRAAPDSVRKMQELAASNALDLAVPYQLDGLEGEGDVLCRVILATLEGEKRAVEADILLPFFGLSTDLGAIASWGLTLERHHLPVEVGTCATSLPGIFAIGDVATYPHKLKLILCGFSEAAQAAHAAWKICHPEQELHFSYSTSKGVPAEV
jgi:thioredoxin reductase (NADPH)